VRRLSVRRSATSLIAAALVAQRLITDALPPTGDDQILCHGGGAAVVCVPTFAELNFVYARVPRMPRRGWM